MSLPDTLEGSVFKMALEASVYKTTLKGSVCKMTLEGPVSKTALEGSVCKMASSRTEKFLSVCV